MDTLNDAKIHLDPGLEYYPRGGDSQFVKRIRYIAKSQFQKLYE